MNLNNLNLNSLLTIMSKFKKKYPFDKRKLDSTQIRAQYADRLPIICEKNNYSNAPDIDKNKYLVPLDLSLGQFISVIRKRMQLHSGIALYIFIDGFSPSNSQFISNLYAEHKDSDGFLYIMYDIENTFGEYDSNL
jgi:GABA(A) receptor-associated protein